MIDLTEEQKELLDNVIKIHFEYKELNKENNESVNDAKNNFYDKVYPKPSGKMNEKDKAFYKESRKELKNFVADSIKIAGRKRKSEPETSYEALQFTSRKDK